MDLKFYNRTFGGIEEAFASLEHAGILLQPIPYDGTSTWGKGADKGFEAFLDASEHMEVYDIETDSEVYQEGICVLEPLTGFQSPESMTKAVSARTEEILSLDKFPTFLGGEHSVSIGIIDAFSRKVENLTVLQLDAHSDLRPEYMGSHCNHACAMHQASQTTNLIQVGIRSMEKIEKPFINPEKIFYAEEMFGHSDWMDQSIQQMTDQVYLSIDLDVFDPSIMPATGTPEPGGLDWDTVIKYLRKVFARKSVVGFDIVEFAPIDGLRAPGFLVAKLYYKLLSYQFYDHGKR
jgi:agmatinase